MSELIENIKLVGGITGLIAFVWNIWVALRAYLVLSMEIRVPTEGDPVVKVSVGNPGLTSKMISYSVLVVTPEGVSLEEGIQRLCKVTARKTPFQKSTSPLSGLFKCQAGSIRHEGGCILIPLREFYEHQSMVGPGETISFACSMSLSSIRPGLTYLVRYFVFISYAGVYVRWRFTTDAFRVSATS